MIREDNGIQIPAVRCASCIKLKQPECPLNEASGWSRWGSWCNKYEMKHDAGEIPEERITCARCESSFRPEYRRVVHIDAKGNTTYECPVCREDLP